ncbi:MAG: FxLYD domain-containing protein [Thermoanaerobaculia bacterium]
MKLLRQGIAAAALAGAAAFALAGDVVVLKGGTVVELREPWVRRGNTAYLTRADGTLLSVSVTEIDREATAAARRAAPPAPLPADAPASTPAEAVRVGRDGPKARVRITDADVSHPMELEPAPGEEKKEQSATNVRVEVADYTQEKNGGTLLVKGSLRNPGQDPAEGVRMAVTAIDEKGQPIDGSNATLSKGTLPAGQAVDFTASLTVGDRTVASLRFAPQWNAPRPPAAPTPRPGAAGAGGAAAAPTPVRTPYGRGTLYAAPAPSAGFQAPADGKTGYIPGPANPDQQPKPPNR